MYWSPFSNGMYGAHPQVPGAEYYENPDFNPDLDPESAVSFNVGLLPDHDDLLADNDGLSLSLDYWSYRFSDPLVVEPFPQVLALACPDGNCDAGNPAYLNRIRFGKATSLAGF